MDYLVVCAVALLISGLTFIAGFGLGTLLMPVFAIFFPLPLAIAATAIVHLANNIFKLGLIGRKADKEVVLKFAIPGFIFALLGAYFLNLLEHNEAIYTYSWLGNIYEITGIKLIIGMLIICFALIDLLPFLCMISIDRRHVSLGGALSGFFGGLSGHQGALRTTFLIKFGLEKEAFIATGIVSAVIVDVGRLIVYGVSFYQSRFSEINGEVLHLVLAASLSAFLGAYFGRRLLKKITFRFVQIIVGFLLIVLGICLLGGII